ncbi:nuclease-related domain-containing protein [Ornithinibacillus bavariensis]|uniref:nuclease-related domain-containing protein n=1 Tax=Ornithinibacillus bavariensis TaxID=545502 RepID=UPI000EBFBD94|nr:nuclease [Ornithinibacillus sp.]
MILKERIKPAKLELLEILNNRMVLDDENKQDLYNLAKGYEGEVLLDTLLQNLEIDHLLVNDLMLQVNNTTFQIDSLLITDAIYMFEVKNYEGDFYYDSNRFYTKDNFEINNPLIQLERTESLLRQLLQNQGINLPIHASVIFINPEFMLYQAPANKPFIFPSQLNRLIKRLNTNPSRITNRHKALANKLISLHQKESPYTRLPQYKYEQLQKGICCQHCYSISLDIEGRRKNCICSNCGYTEFLEHAVLRSVQEYKILFPEEKITTSGIYEWCGLVSKKTISRILEKNYKATGVKRWTYFE